MTIFMLILMCLLHMAAGFGLLAMVKVDMKPWKNICLALMLGIAVFSFVPFFMELLKIPLSKLNVWLGMVVAILACNIHYKASMALVRRSVGKASFRFKLYEIPFVLLIGFILLVSAWRCFYYPPTSRDMLSGPEAIAAFAVKEHTMVNSVFSINLESTNNVFKPAYLTSLQVIYKYAGFEFGQVWLLQLVIAFVVFLYQALAEKLHRIMAGLLIVLFLAIPEMYAYSFMALFDYSNAVFFFLSLYFLQQYFSARQTSDVVMGGIFMAIATYTRSETLVLASLVMPLFILHWFGRRQKFILLFRDASLFILPSLLMYFLSITVFINHYLPVGYSVSELLNKNLFSLKGLLMRIKDVATSLVFGRDGLLYYAYFIYFFLLMVLVELLLCRKTSKTGAYWIYAVLAAYFGLILASHILPLMDIDHSIKRGMFKVFPLMLLFMGNMQVLMNWSQQLENWQRKT